MVRAPTFSPVAGEYTSAKTVTISTTTDEDNLYWSTNNFSDTYSSSSGSGTIVIPYTSMLKAYAVKSGWTDSTIASGLYPIVAPGQVAAPTILPVGGTYSTNQLVTIETNTWGSAVHFTTDGSTPSSSSTAYSGSFWVDHNTTVKAIAVKTDMIDSEITEQSYVIARIVTGVFYATNATVNTITITK